METRSSKRRRLISYVSQQRPDVPATFESLNDDSKRLVLQFVGNKSYATYGGINKHCKAIYLNTNGMLKETFLFGYGPLAVIKDRIKRAMREQFNWEVFETVGVGVVLYNRRDVMEWALEERKEYVLRGICNVAGREDRFDLLEEVWNNEDDEDDRRNLFLEFHEYAARHGKLNVLKWVEMKGLLIDKERCARGATHCGQLHILEWLKEERGLELFRGLYREAVRNDQLHVMKWLREKEVPWNRFTFYNAAWNGNLDILQWLHDEGCPWNRYRVHERWLNPEVIEWLRANGYGDRIDESLA